MKRIFLYFVLATTFFTQLSAQCVPNQLYRDSTFGVYPRPYDPVAYPNGGIKQSACIGKPFKYVLTAKVPDSITISVLGSPLQVKMDSIKLDKKVPTTVQGLPAGMSYNCNPPNCVFKANSLGCLEIFGTATDANKAGDYELKLEMVAYAKIFGIPQTQKVTFPDKTLAPGTYILKLEPKTSTTCFVSNAKDQNENITYINAAPNPTNDFTRINFFVKDNDTFDFIVTDMTGRTIYKEAKTADYGLNYIDFDASNLAAGVYIYYLGNEKGTITNRLMVNR